LLFQVILVIFVPYFYPGENFGAILGYFFVLGGASVRHWKSRACLTPEGKAALTPENLLFLTPVKS
jgi:hypothetical protein